MFQRLPKALAHAKAGNTSENLKDTIKGKRYVFTEKNYNIALTSNDKRIHSLDSIETK